MKGARGVLINITGSSKLSLHDVNEACSLIRAATANEDAQINFGVVLNEAMKDEVKITVIATGFQRDNLPQLARRVPWRRRIAHAGTGASRLPLRSPSRSSSSASLFRDLRSARRPPAPAVEEPRRWPWTISKFRPSCAANAGCISN